jgi:chloride channel protein, CIC family
MTENAQPTPDDGTSEELSAQQADAMIRSRRYVALLVVVAVIGVIVSLAAWCFLEGIHQIQQELYTHLPHALGYNNGPPKWWPLPILAIGALIVAVAIARLPGDGGHIPAEGLSAGGPSGPNALPGVILAGLATIGSGLVLGPEAPLIAIGAGLAALTISLARRDRPRRR